jgi:hypothetical protein
MLEAPFLSNFATSATFTEILRFGQNTYTECTVLAILSSANPTAIVSFLADENVRNGFASVLSTLCELTEISPARCTAYALRLREIRQETD